MIELSTHDYIGMTQKISRLKGQVLFFNQILENIIVRCSILNDKNELELAHEIKNIIGVEYNQEEKSKEYEESKK